MDVDKALLHAIGALTARANSSVSEKFSEECEQAADTLTAHRDALIDAQPVAEEVLRLANSDGPSEVAKGFAMLDLAPALARVVKGGDGKEAAC